MTGQQLHDAARRMRSFAAQAFLMLPRHAALTTGEQVTFVALHHHVDLCIRLGGYVHTRPGDIVHLTGATDSRVRKNLTALVGYGLIRRVDAGGRTAAYRPLRQVEDLVA